MANRRYIDFPIASTSGDTDIILIWQGGANKQTTKATFLSGLPENLDELNDVAISGLTNGQILRYDSVTGKWENTDQGNLDLNDLNDVSIVSPSNGQVLVYNSSTSKWENSSGGFVPYVGAVTTVDLGAQGLRAGYVRFDTTVAGVPNEQGLMFWDADDETVDIILNGYTMKIGEDLFYPVKNQTGSTIAKGVAVRFNGTVGNSGRLLIAPFIADGSVPSSRFMGVTAEEILNGEDGKVLYFGRVRGINTNAFNEGDILYASTTVAGGYQTAIPVAPNNIVQVAAVVTKSATVGTIFVRPTLGSNINKDEGVKIVSVADKNLLQYQSGTSLWENKSLAQVIGSDYVPSTRTITINGTSQDLSANRTYNVGTVTSVGLSSATSGVTIGSSPVTTSGTITLAIATASGSQNGLLSSTDWTTFNNKQNALTNPVTGTGTTNYLPKFTGASTIGNSLVFDNGTNVGINTTTPNDFIDGERGIAILQSTNGRAVLSLVGTRTDANEVLGRISFTNSNSTNVGAKRVSYISGVRGSTNNSAFLEFGVANDGLGSSQMVLSQLGNLLVGASNQSSDNGARLQVSGTAGAGITLRHSNGNVVALLEEFSGVQGAALTLRNSSGTNNIQFNAGGVSYINSGNVGIGTASPSTLLHVNGTTTQITLQNVNGGTNAERIGMFMTDGDIFKILSLNDNNTTRVDNIITANILNGNVGIGTASPSGAAGLALAMNSGANQCRIALKTSSTGDSSGAGLQIGIAGIDAFIEQRQNADLTFATNATERMRITSDAYLRMASNSGGIQFNGDTAAANALDDYEEGTHSPSASPAGGGSFTTVTQSGSYVKIGKLVHYSFIVNVNSVGTATGDVLITLPFVVNLTPIRPMGSGRENALYGNTLQIRTVSDGSATALIIGGGTLANSWQALGSITYRTTA